MGNTDKQFVRYPTEICEALCIYHLSPIQSNIVNYIIRKTYGWNKTKRLVVRMMKMLIDAFGGDNAPLEIIKGSALCLTKYEGVTLGLVGNKEIIEKTAAENQISLDGLEIFDAPDVITMEDDAGEIMKSKKNSSMAVGLRR